MFGRRNPDRPLNPKPSDPPETDLDLDLLEDLPDTPAPASPAPEVSDLPPKPASAYPAWPSSASLVIGSAPARPMPAPAETDQAPPPTPPPAAPPLAAPPAAPVTQELPTVVAPPPVAVPAPSPAAPAASPATATARPRASAESVIGPDDFFDGRYRSERGVRIQGNARGSIESRQYIFVEAGAQVEADLSAEDITVSGDFKGKIECRRRLEVTDTGKVRGEVQTSLLVVQEGGAIDGALHMGHPQEAPADDSA